MVVRLGCSGFLYEHWRERFYPPSQRDRELEFYADRFDTVELNVTFYRMPAAETFRSWASRVPDDFVFAVKASRYLSHIRRLKEPRPSVGRLMERASLLGSHLGPVLLQLPPDLPIQIDALEETLDAFPKDVRGALEPRHRSWFTEGLRTLLTSRGAALCLADRRGPSGPVWRTADWTYLRLHAGRASPRPCYGTVALDSWAQRLAEGWGADPTGFTFFNNDQQGCALHDSVTMAHALMSRGLPIGRMPQVPHDVLRDR
jgi:uncharacterized protein YecE (DUF72 family)